MCLELFYAVAGTNPPASSGFFLKGFSTCSEINDLTVLLLNTNCIESVVQTLDNQCFTSRRDRYLSF